MDAFTSVFELYEHKNVIKMIFIFLIILLLIGNYYVYKYLLNYAKIRFYDVDALMKQKVLEIALKERTK